MTSHVVLWHYSTKALGLIPICMSFRPEFCTTTSKQKEVDCTNCKELLAKK